MRSPTAVANHLIVTMTVLMLLMKWQMAISNSKKHCTLQCRVETLPADSNCDETQLAAVTIHLPLINWKEIPTLTMMITIIMIMIIKMMIMIIITIMMLVIVMIMMMIKIVRLLMIRRASRLVGYCSPQPMFRHSSLEL